MTMSDGEDQLVENTSTPIAEASKDTPTTDASAPEGPSSAEEVFDWGSINDDEEKPTAEAAPEQPQAVGEEEKDVPAPQPEPTAEQPVEAKPEEPKADQPQETQAKPDEPVGEQPDQAVLRAKFVEELETHYAMAPDEVEQFNAEPEKVLPKMAARLHADLYDSVLRTVYAQLPQMMQTLNQAEQQISAGEQKFFAEWPELKDHQEAVGQIGAVYRQLYPNATMEEAIKTIGSMAMTQLGLQRAPQAAPPQQQQQRPQPAPPHAPAAAAVSAAPAEPAGQSAADFWSKLAAEEV